MLTSNQDLHATQVTPSTDGGSFGNSNFNDNFFDDNRWDSSDDDWQIPEFGEHPKWAMQLASWVEDPANELAKILAVELIQAILTGEPRTKVHSIWQDTVHITMHWQLNSKEWDTFYESFWNQNKSRFYASDIWRPLGIQPEQLPIILDKGDIGNITVGKLTKHHTYDLRSRLASAEMRYRLRSNKKMYADLCLAELLKTGADTSNKLIEFGQESGLNTLSLDNLSAEVFAKVYNNYQWPTKSLKDKSAAELWYFLAA